MNQTFEEVPAMYEMYPEWGPAAHDAEHPANPVNQANKPTWTSPVQESMDRRDNGGERPDDN